MEKATFLNNLFARHPSCKDKYSYELVPENFATTSRIDLICKTHGRFTKQASTLYTTGNGCQLCGEELCRNNHALTTNEYIQKSKAKFGNKFSYDKTEYCRQNVELTITCPEHGEFTVSPKQHLIYKHGCPKCDYEIPRKIRTAKLIEKARVIHGDKYDYRHVVFSAANEKMELICPDHGSFWQSLYDHTEKGTACPKCRREDERVSLGEFITKAKEVHGDRYNYDKVVLCSLMKKVIINCPEHGDWLQRAHSHLVGNGCKKCFREASKLSVEEFIKNAKEVHGDRYNYDKVHYLGNKTPVEVVCPTHGSFWIKPNIHVSSRNGCRFCQESKGEIATEMFLKRYGIDYIREYRILPHKYRYDFYLPKFDIFIEYHGIQHYRAVDAFGGHSAFVANKKRDLLKKRLVKEHGGKLIVLSYLDLNAFFSRKLQFRLRSVYKLWCTVSGETIAFKTVSDLYKRFDLPEYLSEDEALVEIKKDVADFKVLFGYLRK